MHGCIKFQIYDLHLRSNSQYNHKKIVTRFGSGWEFKGRCVIISWYEHSSLSVHWITPSSTRTFPYVLLKTKCLNFVLLFNLAAFLKTNLYLVEVNIN